MDHPFFMLEATIASLAETVILGLATVAVLRAWFQGSIFENWRAYFEARGGRLGTLLGCPLCLSYHVAFGLELLFSVPLKIAVASWWIFLFAPLVVLAAAALAWACYEHEQ